MKKPRFSLLDGVTAVVAVTALAVSGYRGGDYLVKRYTDPERPTRIASGASTASLGIVPDPRTRG